MRLLTTVSAFIIFILLTFDVQKVAAHCEDCEEEDPTGDEDCGCQDDPDPEEEDCGCDDDPVPEGEDCGCGEKHEEGEDCGCHESDGGQKEVEKKNENKGGMKDMGGMNMGGYKNSGGGMKNMGGMNMGGYKNYGGYKKPKAKKHKDGCKSGNKGLLLKLFIGNTGPNAFEQGQCGCSEQVDDDEDDEDDEENYNGGNQGGNDDGNEEDAKTGGGLLDGLTGGSGGLLDGLGGLTGNTDMLGLNGILGGDEPDMDMPDMAM